MNLVLRVLPLALGAAVSPTVLAVVLLLLATKARGKALAGAFTAGAFVPLAALTVLTLTIWRTAADHARHPNAVSAGIDLAFGLALILFGLHTLLTPAPDRPPRPRSFRVGSAFALGVVVMATNFSSLLLVMPALKEVTQSRQPFGPKAVAVLVIVLFTMLPALVPIGFALAAPGAADRVLGAVRTFVQRHSRAIGMVISMVFGVYLSVKGARGF